MHHTGQVQMKAILEGLAKVEGFKRDSTGELRMLFDEVRVSQPDRKVDMVLIELCFAGKPVYEMRANADLKAGDFVSLRGISGDMGVRLS